MHYFTAHGSCAGMNAGTSSFMPEPTPPCGSWQQIAVEDFDLLFSAVAERLRQAALEDAAPLASVVLECAEALGQLQRMLRQARETSQVQVLREQGSGAIVNCWASPQARGKTLRNNGLWSLT